MSLTFKGEEYITGREAARIIQVSRSTFYDRCVPWLREQGQVHKLPGYDREYFKKTEIEAYNGPRPVRGK